MFSIFKSKTHKPTHCWTCAKKFRIFTCHANECADCGRSICRDCAVSMRILNKKIKLCFECCGTLTSRRSRPTMTTTPSETNNTLVLSPPQAASHDSRGPCESILFSTVGSDLEEERELMQQVDACLSFLDITQDETTASTTTITVAVVAFENGLPNPSPNTLSLDGVPLKGNDTDGGLGSQRDVCDQQTAKCILDVMESSALAKKSSSQPVVSKNSSAQDPPRLLASQHGDLSRQDAIDETEMSPWPSTRWFKMDLACDMGYLHCM
ncbi:hypothetical protein LEN26_012030 [Aphanomyces euteiches]|nr:hypothetical protein LEN26_012030 [Aphanomyces euteiches]KAH9121687.1 hypothetical protein AeMF1_006703 [Aphanomyces euteiches]